MFILSLLVAFFAHLSSSPSFSRFLLFILCFRSLYYSIIDSLSSSWLFPFLYFVFNRYILIDTYGYIDTYFPSFLRFIYPYCFLTVLFNPYFLPFVSFFGLSFQHSLLPFLFYFHSILLYSSYLDNSYLILTFIFPHVCNFSFDFNNT